MSGSEPGIINLLPYLKDMREAIKINPSSEDKIVKLPEPSFMKEFKKKTEAIGEISYVLDPKWFNRPLS